MGAGRVAGLRLGGNTTASAPPPPTPAPDAGVVAALAVADETSVTGQSAQQHGHWTQDVTAPDGKAMHVSRVFDPTWHHDADGAWRIAKMHTQS